MKFSECLAWYSGKVRPPTTVTLKNLSDHRKNGPKIRGHLDRFSEECIVLVTAGTEERKEIPVESIKALYLTWNGTFNSDDHMGELDGTAWEGQHLPATTYHHKVERHPKLGWQVEEKRS